VFIAGTGRVTMPINVNAPSLMLRLDWVSTASVILQNVQLRFHPLGLDDAVVMLPVRCTDYMTGINGRPLRENGKGRGEQLARWLESLTQTRVKFQDRDYPITGTAGTTWECLSVELAEGAVSDRRFGRQAWQGIATVTLRKSD
jgi:hypothetical protein